jgi:hypothetical protein
MKKFWASGTEQKFQNGMSQPHFYIKGTVLYDFDRWRKLPTRFSTLKSWNLCRSRFIEKRSSNCLNELVIHHALAPFSSAFLVKQIRKKKKEKKSKYQCWNVNRTDLSSIGFFHVLDFKHIYESVAFSITLRHKTILAWQRRWNVYMKSQIKGPCSLNDSCCLWLWKANSLSKYIYIYTNNMAYYYILKIYMYVWNIVIYSHFSKWTLL